VTRDLPVGLRPLVAANRRGATEEPLAPVPGRPLHWLPVGVAVLLSGLSCTSPQAHAGDAVVMRGEDRAIEALRLPPEGSERHASFEGKVPCDGCNAMKIGLTLHTSREDQRPTTYVLERIGVGGGNDRLVSQGSWSRAPSRRFGEATVIRLDERSPPDLRVFLALSDDVLIVADEDERPRVGTPQHGFALSRVQAPRGPRR
jgi:hypothetical protein